MCGKPMPKHYRENLARLMVTLREELTEQWTWDLYARRYEPADGFAWVGSRLYYGTVEAA